MSYQGFIYVLFMSEVFLYKKYYFLNKTNKKKPSNNCDDDRKIV